MKAIVDKDTCVGCGLCASNASDIFRMGDDGLAEAYGEVDAANEEIAKEVIAGKWGNGQTRKDKLKAAGYDYATVQAIVDKLLNKSTAPAKKSNETIAKEVLQGKWGNGSERKKKIEAAGYNYSAIQAIVNKLCK